MEERRLGPVVGLGTWNTFDTDAELAEQVVQAAVDAGVRLFDTSPMYGGAEHTLAAALDGIRDEVTVATKIWTSSLDEGREQFRRQLEWYEGRVDIEQVHNLVAWREHLDWLEAEREAGRVGRIGVTHWQASAFPELAAELGLPVIVMRPLGSGALVRREPPREQLEPLGVESWAEALLKWALSDERIDVVIPATRHPERARANARAGDGPWFDAEQRALVERLAGA
jgi:diketogulonate reductase-like aldo/keto reductase